MKNLFFLPFPLHFSSGRVSGAGKGGNLRGGRRRKERGGPGFCELSKIGVVVGRTDGTGRNDARGEGGRRRGKRSKKKKFPPRHEKRKRRLHGRKKKQKRVIILLHTTAFQPWHFGVEEARRFRIFFAQVAKILFSC